MTKSESVCVSEPALRVAGDNALHQKGKAGRVASLLAVTLLTSGLGAAELEVTLEIPRLNVAEYHRPYIAIWVERPDQTVAVNLAAWYDQQTDKSEQGTTWLKDLRMWWRKAGRDLTLPIDGVSGATRAPGVHQLTFGKGNTSLAQLPPGQYNLVVEASREVGGRELLRVPFEWPKSAAQPGVAKGQRELVQTQVAVKP